jgi:hypothetical protein
MTRKRIVLVMVIAVLLATAVVTAAATGLVHFGFTGGGGRSEASGVVLQGALGQSIAGRSVAGAAVLCSGWPDCPPLPTETPTASATTTATSTATTTATSTSTATTTSTATATNTATTTSTATATSTSTATATATSTATATATSAPTATPTVTVTGTPPATLVAPVLIAPADGTVTADNTLGFVWGPVAGAAQYRLQVDDEADFLAPEIDILTAASGYTPATGLAGGGYFWRVQAKDATDIWGDWSVTWSFTIQPAYVVYVPMLVRE